MVMYMGFFHAVVPSPALFAIVTESIRNEKLEIVMKLK